MEEYNMEDFMKNKNIYIGSIIRAVIISIFLIIIVIKNQDIISKLIILPFLFCGIFTIGKNACLLKENKRGANIFSKLFVLSFLTFWFGFLVIWSYLFIRKNSYFPLVFTIPFWIVGIYIVRKFLLGMSSKEETKNKESKFNFSIIVSSFLVLLVLIIGITCLYFGIKDTYKLNSNFLIFFGAFFTLGGTVFVLAALQMKGIFDKVKIDVVGTYIGFVMLIIGVGIILFQNGTTLSFIETIKSLGIWILIPILFIVSGIYLTIKNLFLDNNNK